MSPEEKKKPQGGARVQRTEQPKKKNKPQRTRQQKILRALYIALTVVAALIVVLFVVYRLLVVKPTLPNPDKGDKDKDQQEEVVEPTSGPKLSGDRKEEFYTFMVVGRDTGGGGNTDTIMVLAYDIPNQQLNVMSIPRDTMVNVPWDIKRINSVYNYAPYYDKDGIAFLKEEVSALIGFQPDFAVTVEWEAVGELVDAIGGVMFDVPIDMNYDDPTQNLHIHLSAGYQEIDGSKAMQLLRWRKNSTASGKAYGGYPNGDLGRIETQQAFLKAVIQKCLSSMKDVSTISKMAKIFMANVETDLTVNNLAWFAQEAILGGLTMEHVNFMTLPNKGVSVYSRTYGNYQSYVTPIPDQMLEMVNTYFNPFLDDVALNQLDLMGVTSSGALTSTAGRVEDTKAANPPKKPANTTTTPTDNPAPEVPEEPEEPAETTDVTPTPTPGVTPDGGQSETPPASPGVTPGVSASPAPGNSPDVTATPAPTPTPSVPPSAAPTPTPAPTPAPPAPTPDAGYGPGMEPIE